MSLQLMFFNVFSKNKLSMIGSEKLNSNPKLSPIKQIFFNKKPNANEIAIY